MMISYAQNFEDVMLWRAVGHVGEGFYIDIGAQDPVVDSVSLAFHEKGWRGIHVEPSVHYASLLRQQRPGDAVIQAAVGETSGVLPFFEIPGTGISTLSTEIATQHGEHGFDVHETTTPVVTLASILEMAGGRDVHWMKIDVEGFERQVLASWGNCPVRPWVVVVESTLPLTQIESHRTWEGALRARGYSFAYFDGLNRYYLSKSQRELRQAFAVPPNVFDGFELNGTASSTFHRLIEKRFEAQVAGLNQHVEKQTLASQAEVTAVKVELSAALTEVDRERTAAAERERELAREADDASGRLAAAKQARELAAEQASIQAQREQALQAQLESAHQERARAEQVAAQREAALHDQLTKAADALNVQMQVSADAQALVQRLVQKHPEEQQAFAERERALQEALQTAHQILQQEGRSRAEREQEAAAELLAMRVQLDAQLRSHGEQERVLREALKAAQTELGQQKELWAERERHAADRLLALQQQTKQDLAHEERARREHEQELADQILALRQQAQHERDALARGHREQLNALSERHAQTERGLRDALQATQRELVQEKQARIEREREISAQLLSLNRQAQEERDTLTRAEAQQRAALAKEHAEREHALQTQLQEVQETLSAVRHESTRELASMTAKHAIAMQASADANLERENSLGGLISGLEADLRTRLAAEQSAVSQLSTVLALARHELATMRKSWVWRLTAPLRKVAAVVGVDDGRLLGTSVVKAAPASSIEGCASPASAAPIATQSVCCEPLTAPRMKPHLRNDHLTVASAEELLGLQDEQFVRSAFLSVLNRPVDAAGFASFLERVRSGVDKEQILLALATSPEGRILPADRLPGLREAVERARRNRPSLWVRGLRRIASEALRPITARLCATECRLSMVADSMQHRFDQLEAAIYGPGAAGIRTVVASEDEDLKHLTAHAREIYFQLKGAGVAAQRSRSAP